MIFIDQKLWQVASGTPIGNVDVGDIVQLRENLVPVDYIVVHQGLPSSMYDASCDGTWLLRKRIPSENHIWSSNNTNAIASSDIQSFLNSTILNRYDDNIKSSIKQARIPYCLGGGNSEVMSGANGLLCKIFILSGYEVGYDTSVDQYFPFDGAKLAYFLSGDGPAANSRRRATKDGETVGSGWCLRSPDTEGSDKVFNIGFQGRYNTVSSNNPTFGFRPAHILPPDFGI